MSCCVPAEARLDISAAPSPAAGEILLASRDLGDGTRQTDLSVPSMRCAACIAAVEGALEGLPEVESARVNLSMKRVSVRWRETAKGAPDMIAVLERIGYPAHLFSHEVEGKDPELSRLIRALAVAGFCAMNIMLLSVSVWLGADERTRQAFHLLSAALALPAVLYSGRVFYLSAWSALRHGRTNMDVPITIGVVLAYGLSLYDTFHAAPHAYFDASATLLFFLLIGRTLDHVMRERARSAVTGLARLSPLGATLVEAAGTRRHIPLSEVEPGAILFVAPGDRIPVDGVVETGSSDLDRSLVSGDSAPVRAEPGTPVEAGLMNLTGPLTIRATARAEDSFLAEMVRLMEAAEGGRARYRRIADRAAALYAPVVHSVAALSFAAWLAATGDLHLSITIAISVLIITCPCALGLAVPIVQVVAAGRLFERGIMVKDGSALERLAEADAVLFDKTGTLTLGNPRLANADEVPPSFMEVAAGLSAGSRHPVARALSAAARRASVEPITFDEVTETPGLGLEGIREGRRWRLGRAAWAIGRDPDEREEESATSTAVLARDGAPLARFVLEDQIRPEAERTIQSLARQGFRTEIVSGDRESAVAALAARVGVACYSAGLLPAEKIARIATLDREGGKVLMVGDGLNDAPALAAAHVSMAPATAADIGRNAADFVFLKESLSAVSEAIMVARRAGGLVRQNFALAVGYNLIAVPIAVCGYVTPLVAALAMSLSSVLVVANAMRLRRQGAARAGSDFVPRPQPRQLPGAAR